MRKIKDNLFKYTILFFGFLSIIPLILIFVQIVSKGVGVINFEFLTSLPKPAGESGGGILNAITGTLILISVASLIAIPFGVLVGIFAAESKNTKIGNILGFTVNVIQGIPSIIIGIIAYTWIVIPMGGFSALSGAVALAIMMLPMIIKSTEETVKMIPDYLREASYGLGVTYTNTMIKVVIPTALKGIISGTIISIARIAGETAPLLFTALGSPYLSANLTKPIDSLALLIFNFAMSPYDNWHKIAWGASFILITFVLTLNLAVTILTKKWKVKL